MIATTEIGVQSSGQHLRQYADDIAAAMHPSHEAGMNIAGRIGRDEIRIFAIDLAELAAFTRNLGAKPRANLIGDRTPDRLLANIGDGVDHVIEHAMSLRAHSSQFDGSSVSLDPIAEDCSDGDLSRRRLAGTPRATV